MVVQHNISAMNANRYFGINNSGLSKSLEKLSSGYAINRAGDNAAGLAVSEKMRAQISGLTQATKNAQDGISMVQTFEGALTETDSILQRMRTLAVQSANGTYQDDVDRDAIQLEFDQLNDELNQIADTDFNGVVVLNGGTMADGTVVNNKNLVSTKPENTPEATTDPAGAISYSQNVNGAVDSAVNGVINVDGVSVKLEAGAGKVTAGTSTYEAKNVKVADGAVSEGTITVSEEYAIDADTTNITLFGKNYTVDQTNTQLLDENGDKVEKVGGLTVTVTKGASVKLAGDYTITDGVVKNADGEDIGSIDLSNGVSESNAYNQSTTNLTYTDSITLQTGARSKDAVNFNFAYTSSGLGELKADLDCSARGLGTNQLSVSTQEDANAAIDRIDNAINKVSMVRSTFGAMQNRLEHKIANLEVNNENLTAAESRIRDTDMAKEMTNFTKNQILSQASQAMLAQANQLPQGVLQLLG